MPREPDLTRFRAAVLLRDRCRRAAMAAHERAGLAPSVEYANSTYDAITDVIREAFRAVLAEEIAAAIEEDAAYFDTAADCAYAARIARDHAESKETR